MQILVCVKQVPSVNEGRLDRKTGTLLRADLPAVMNPYDGRALEMALQLRDKTGGNVTVLTMGPASAVSVLKESLAMGADGAVLLSDLKFAGADVVATAYTISQAVRVLPTADIIICGRQSTDGDTGQVSGALAAFLDLPFATGVDSIFPDKSGSLRLRQRMGTVHMEACYPLCCVVAVENETVTPRIPSLRRRLAVSSVPIKHLTLADLPDKDPSHYGTTGSATRVVHTYRPPEPTGKTVIPEACIQPDVLLRCILGDKEDTYIEC